jgi:hypothetical protein
MFVLPLKERDAVIVRCQLDKGLCLQSDIDYNHIKILDMKKIPEEEIPESDAKVFIKDPYHEDGSL